MSACGVPQWVATIEPGQRADPVNPLRIAERLEIWRLEVGIRKGRLADIALVVLARHGRDNDLAVGVHETHCAVVELQTAAGVDQPRVHRRGIAEIGDLVGEAVDHAFEEGQRTGGDRLGFRQAAQDLLAYFAVERRVDAARHDPGRMDALPPQPFDHLLAELAQRNAVASHVGMVLQHPNDVAPFRRTVEPEEQVGRGEMEEAQRVRLRDLAAVHRFAQLGGDRRDAHAHDGVAGLCRGQEMADRADAADAGGDRGHFVKGPSLAELLEAAHLGDVEVGFFHLVVVVELDGDLGVALDARDRINDDGLHGRPPQPNRTRDFRSGTRPSSNSLTT